MNRKSLVIVESPNKIKKIQSFLGSDFEVMASVGHVRDLPAKDLGLAPPDFRLAYEPTERGEQAIRRLQTAARSAETVYLATDPDREGEAIAWHLSDALNLTHPKRVTFTAITKEKVLAAIAAPRAIDMDLVHAQEARRALDRIIGYRVSPALRRQTGHSIGAGRVQSPAVRLVVDRERAIQAFQPVTHYGVELSFPGDWTALWNVKPHLKDGEEWLTDPDLAARVAGVRQVVVTGFEDTRKSEPPPAPFITSTLQQAASRALKMKPRKTMEVAQKLYEQGAITYHRTDAPNIDPEGVEDIAAYGKAAGLSMAPTIRRWKAKDGAQEGHEAIRPTRAAEHDLGETPEEKALYRLIWQRAIASQMADALYAVRSARLGASLERTPISFTATGRTLTDPGWRTVYGVEEDDSEKEEGEPASNPIPALDVRAHLTAQSARVLEKKTRPPTRFKEASLIAELEKRGIGRPSTYAAILENITSRGYLDSNSRGFLIPTPDGETIRDALVDRFQFVDLDFTKGLEDRLDLIADGKTDYRSVVEAAWAGLDIELGRLDTAPATNKYPCPACGKALRQRTGKNGAFWSCSGWPECNTSLNDNKGKPEERRESDQPCPDCGKPLRLKSGPKGPFWGCSGYPECTATLPDNKGKPGVRKAPPPPSGIACPQCGKTLAHRTGTSKPKTKGGKGHPYDFWSCTGYPICTASFKTGDDGQPLL